MLTVRRISVMNVLTLHVRNFTLSSKDGSTLFPELPWIACMARVALDGRMSQIKPSEFKEYFLVASSVQMI